MKKSKSKYVRSEGGSKRLISTGPTKVTETALDKIRQELAKRGWKFKLMTVTPDIAEKWLATQAINRPIRNDWVEAYARDMVAGKWMLNGSTILLSCEGSVPDYEAAGGRKHVPAGSLLDGQHRLWACSIAKTPFKTLVVFGVEPETFATIDSGVARTNGDSLVGEKYPSELGTALRLLWLYRKTGTTFGGAKQRRVNRGELLALLQKVPSIRQAVARAHEITGNTVPLIPRSSMAFLMFVFAEKHSELADLFFVGLQSGEGLTKTGRTASVFGLRTLLLKWGQRKERNPIIMRVAAIIKAWNLFIEGSTGVVVERTLVWRRYGETPEAFPKIR